MGVFVETKGLQAGYRGKVLLEDVCLQVEKGKILTLIGPNGAGKSTILKTITKHLAPLGGEVVIGGENIERWSCRALARQVAVVLTDRIRPELMTCFEVVAMGRYPYTGALGRLTPEDKVLVHQALEQVQAEDLAQRDFSTLSDGQRQRVLLARAICQEPKVLVLDEPTAYLDVRYKVELLNILRRMARDTGVTVILSLHEIDLATKASDYLLFVQEDRSLRFGTPEEMLSAHAIDQLYGLEEGAYNALFGTVELTRPQGEPQVYVVAGGGYGAPIYRALQRSQLPFATGLLFENDVDYQVARVLSRHVAVTPAFELPQREAVEAAQSQLARCQAVVDAGTPVGTMNRANETLLEKARALGLPVLSGLAGLEAWRKERGT